MLVKSPKSDALPVDCTVTISMLLKAALVNYKKAPFVSKQEMIILEELLDRVNDL